MLSCIVSFYIINSSSKYFHRHDPSLGIMYILAREISLVAARIITSIRFIDVITFDKRRPSWFRRFYETECYVEELVCYQSKSLQWRRNGRDGVSNHQPDDCLLYSGADQRKHQSSAALAFVRGIHRSPVNSPHKWSVTRKMFPWWRHHFKRHYYKTNIVK